MLYIVSIQKQCMSIAFWICVQLHWLWVSCTLSGFTLLIERLGESGLRPDSRTSGPYWIRWTSIEVRWVVNERAMVATGNAVQLALWLTRETRVVRACQFAPAPDSVLAESCIGLVWTVQISQLENVAPRHGLWVVCRVGLTWPRLWIYGCLRQDVILGAQPMVIGSLWCLASRFMGTAWRCACGCRC